MLIRIWGPDDRRSIIVGANGLYTYVDPFTNLGNALLTSGTFEQQTEEILRASLGRGDVFLDIGANEGYFSALAGTLVGPTGSVIAVEPQSRLRDIIELNLHINDVTRYRVYTNAFGGEDGAEARINLWPTHNTGASSMVRRYRFSRRTEAVRFVSLERIFTECSVDHVDLVKVDVEGFEGQVVRHLVPQLRGQRVKFLLLDYHRQILDPAGIDARAIHNEILGCGYRLLRGNEAQLDSYQLYQGG
jgi:FkbM family methyltransferase